MTTDRVILQDEDGHQMSLPWSDTWPPPENLYIVNAQEGAVLINPERQSAATMYQVIVQHGGVRFLRQSASEIPEPAEEGEHWFRGALYVPQHHPPGVE